MSGFKKAIFFKNPNLVFDELLKFICRNGIFTIFIIISKRLKMAKAFFSGQQFQKGQMVNQKRRTIVGTLFYYLQLKSKQIQLFR
jgi:hypothetical protein